MMLQHLLVRQTLLAMLMGLLFALSSNAHADDEPTLAPENPRRYVALVVGLSSYQNLPDEVELDFARSNAATIASTLRERAHFDEVYLLADGVATRDNIRAHLRNKAPQLLDKNDLFLLYFEGHGVGADLGLPTLLAFDSTLENGQEDGLELETFARDLQTWIQSGSFLIVTDAIHHNQLDGIYFYGPSAEQWPRMPQGTMIISSSKSNTPAKDGEFGIAFADAVAGAADANQDRKVQADEFYTYMSERLKSKNQMPIVAGDYDTSFIIAEDVTPGLTSQAGFGPIEEDSDVVYPDTRIRKAKFVWREGTSQQVHCRQAPVMSCAPMCYVNAFKAGPCRLSAVVKGQSLKGSVIVLEPGAYECSEENGKLACSGP